jgi:hypothetical protein
MFLRSKESASVCAQKREENPSDFLVAIRQPFWATCRVSASTLSLPRFRGPLPHPATRFSAWAPDAATATPSGLCRPIGSPAPTTASTAAPPRLAEITWKGKRGQPEPPEPKQREGHFVLGSQPARSRSPTPRPQLACVRLPPLSRFLLRFLRRPVSSSQFVARAIAAGAWVQQLQGRPGPLF